MAEAVTVAVRCRPLNRKEEEEKSKEAVKASTETSEVDVTHGSESDDVKRFTFDQAHPPETSQSEVFDKSALHIVNSALNGYNGTIFCYGQTGTGKTHTMEGKPNTEEEGVILRAFRHIFSHIDGAEPEQTFLVRASFVELYNEGLRDLLNNANSVNLKESKKEGVYLNGVTWKEVGAPSELNEVLEAGRKNRAVGATAMNADSSRSHSIFTVSIEMGETAKDGSGTRYRVGKLNLVDLAGSERQTKTEATGDRLKEATKINLALTALGNVISALVEGKKGGHIPYRDSKLTRLLQDSLGGNARTVMIANIGPANSNVSETLSTLRYASRTKSIKNKPTVNEDPKDAMLRKYQEEVEELKRKLEGREGGSAGNKKKKKKKKEEEEEEKGVNQDTIERAKEEARNEFLQNQKRSKGGAGGGSQQEGGEIDENAQEEGKEEVADEDEEDEEEKELQRQLEAMQGKILKGNDNLEEREREREKEKERQRREIEAKKEKERNIEEKVQELEGAKNDLQKGTDELQAEQSRLTKRMNKARSRVNGLKKEVGEAEAEQEKERSNVLSDIEQLSAQVKLVNLVLDVLIPQSYQKAIMDATQWSDEDHCWMLPNEHMSGNALRRRSETEDASPRGAKAPDLLGGNDVYFSYKEQGRKPKKDDKARPATPPRPMTSMGLF